MAEVVEDYLRILFGRSDPGDTIHHLLIASCPPEDRTALGGVQTDKLQLSMYAIAPVGPIDVERFIAQSIRDAIAQQRRDGLVPYFAGLAREMLHLDIEGDEVAENRARRMRADGKLQDHPDAAEVTLLYAACTDGRRWVGEHVLTGAKAGTVVGPELRNGAITAEESGLHKRLVRVAAGLVATAN